MTTTAKPKPAAATVGVIDPAVVYTLDAFMRATGLSRAAIRAMRREGFPVRRLSKRAFVVGSDFRAFLERGGHD